jgi:tRNA threonylcarbamoyl adenosine modification protein YeaZ
VIVLSIDTCDLRGSVAVLRDEAVLGVLSHESKKEYSSWLLPTVDELLKEAGLRLASVDAFAVAAGPGSFTGVRVGLTTVKAWAEVYGRPVAAVSRLEAIASQTAVGGNCVAAFVDGQRGQVFGAVYREEGSGLVRVGEETVIAPGKFVDTAVELSRGERIAWVSPDPAVVAVDPAWKERAKRGESVEQVSATLAGVIGRIGLRRLQVGKTTDALGLDANYVRRSDAEIFWKGGAAHGH